MSTLALQSTAPSTTLPRLMGDPELLPATTVAEVSVLLFVKNECPTCRMTLPFVGRLVEAYGDKISFSIIMENEADDAQILATHGKIPGERVFLEAEPYATSAAYELESVPALFLIDREGKVQDKQIGWNRTEYEALNTKLASMAEREAITLVRETDGKVRPWMPG